MDITVEMGDYKLNVRSAAMIIHNNKILVHKNINNAHYGLPGGRVSIGESSEETVIREIQEEIGKEVNVLGYIATVENFFEKNNQKYHEILFVYQADFVKQEDREIEHQMANIEGKEYLKYEWLSLDEIEKYSILPECTKEILKCNTFPIHKINRC